MNILVIDDDPEDTLLFCEALSELHPNAICIVAHTCENIKTTMELIPQVDIIFIDGHMYPLDGKACLEQLIKFVDRSRTKIVIHSSFLSQEDQVALEVIGVDDFLIKAPNYQMLKSNIGRLLAFYFSTIV